MSERSSLGEAELSAMQVQSSTRLSDRDSVVLGVALLKKYFGETGQELAAKRTSRYHVVSVTLAKYNRDQRYISEVFELIHILWAQVATEYRTEFEENH